MNLYNLILSSSGEVVNIFEWDGVSEIYVPTGFITSLNSTGSLQDLSILQTDESGSFDYEESKILIGDLLGNVKADSINASDIYTGKISSKELIQLGEAIFGGILDVTGSFNVSGSLTLNDKTIDDILDNQGINATNFGRLKYENQINFDSTSLILPNYLDTNEAPKRTYFRFNKERNGENWNDGVQAVTDPIDEITLSLDNLDLDSETAYRSMLWDILTGNWKFSELTLTSVQYPQTYKTFEILDGVSYQKHFLTNTSRVYYDLPMGRTWGILNDPDPDFRFRNEHQYSLEVGGRITYVKLTVREIDSGVDLNRLPQHDDEFTIGIKKNKQKRKEVFEFTTSTQWTVPSWADKITIYSVGAGGGGGGGSAGWGHKSGIMLTENQFDDDVLVFVKNGEYGFPFATGGGGGAGGSVAISEFSVDKNLVTVDLTNYYQIGKTVLPFNAKLNIMVGSGGNGGRGLTNQENDYTRITVGEIKNAFWDYNVNANEPLSYNIKTPKFGWLWSIIDSDLERDTGQYFNMGWGGVSTNGLLKKFIRELSYATNPPDWDAYLRIQVGNNETFGKDGGFSSVYLDTSSYPFFTPINSIELLRATGGYGGMSGFALQAYIHPFHYNCGYDKGAHDITNPISVGGGSSIVGAFANNGRVVIGGHGGHGVTMPDIYSRSVYDTIIDIVNGSVTKTDIKKDFINEVDQPPDGCIEANIASDISMLFTKRKVNPVFGSIYKFNQTETYETHGYKKIIYRSGNKNESLAPLGGNGGLGITTAGLENRDNTSVVFSGHFGVRQRWVNPFTNEMVENQPTEWYRWISQKIQSAIVYGNNYRPKININNSLIQRGTVTAVNGIPKSTYEFRLKDTGALGGLDIYTCTDGTPVELTSVPLAERVPTQPENGGDYGQGGGGGAAAYTTDWSQRTTPIQGQNGGDGANGIVIIIAEEL